MSNFEIIKFELDKTKIQHHQGYCWKIILPYGIAPTVNICYNMKMINIPCFVPNNITSFFDNALDPTSSRTILYQNDKAIENLHSNIEDIVTRGNGLYRFWEDTLYFSVEGNGEISRNKYHVVIFTKDDITNEKFEFGINWIDYVSNSINDRVITEAGKYLDEWFSDLKDKRVVDVGCGSGLSSLCFMKRNVAKMVSFDVDPNCIIATKKLASIHYPNLPENWIITHGSVLDESFILSLGQFDVVHVWGVLHHTGNMWKAVENTIKLIKPGGLMLLSLYSGIKTYQNDKLMKEMYNKSNRYGKINYIADYVMLIRKWRHDAKQDPHDWNTLQSTRGMRKYNDLVDWLGGLPYEVTDTSTISYFCGFRGLHLLKYSDPPSKACHEWLFQKDPSSV